MTQSDLNKAALVMFATRCAGEGASLEQQKAIAFCIRNRVKAGWGDGSWLTVMEEAGEYMGNLPGPQVRIDSNSKTLARLMRDVDEIYYGGGRFQGGTEEGQLGMGAEVGGDLESAIGNSKFWLFMREPFNPWFVERIMHDPENHPNHAQMGLMQFFD